MSEFGKQPLCTEDHYSEPIKEQALRRVTYHGQSSRL